MNRKCKVFITIFVLTHVNCLMFGAIDTSFKNASISQAMRNSVVLQKEKLEVLMDRCFDKLQRAKRHFMNADNALQQKRKYYSTLNPKTKELYKKQRQAREVLDRARKRYSCARDALRLFKIWRVTTDRVEQELLAEQVVCLYCCASSGKKDEFRFWDAVLKASSVIKQKGELVCAELKRIDAEATRARLTHQKALLDARLRHQGFVSEADKAESYLIFQGTARVYQESPKIQQRVKELRKQVVEVLNLTSESDVNLVSEDEVQALQDEAYTERLEEVNYRLRKKGSSAQNLTPLQKAQIEKLNKELLNAEQAESK